MRDARWAEGVTAVPLKRYAPDDARTTLELSRVYAATVDLWHARRRGWCDSCCGYVFAAWYRRTSTWCCPDCERPVILEEL